MDTMFTYEMNLFTCCVYSSIVFVSHLGPGAFWQMPSFGIYIVFIFFIQQWHNSSMMCGLLEEAMPWRAVWRFSILENGALFVMTIGT